MSVLERLTVSETDRPKLVEALVQSPAVSEAMLVSTCNRVEVYAVVEAFHPALEAVGDVFGEHTGMTVNELTGHAYVRYSEAAVEHLFTVAAGLDSMVVGEQQILGQIRSAYTEADENKSAGRTLHELAQQALRVGKRVHTETGIDRAGASVVSVALLCVSFGIFLLARVPLAADVYFIPVNYPAAEETALMISFVGLALYLIAIIALVVEAFAAKRVAVAAQPAVAA